MPFGVDDLAIAGLALGGVSSIANFGLGLANYNYQKDLQRSIFNREDTSIARRVQDLKASGLSPVLAAGQGAGTGAIVSTKAPEIDPSLAASLFIQLSTMEKDFAVKDEQIKLLQSQQGLNHINQKIKDLDYYYYDKTGISPNSSAFGKAFRDIVSMYSKFKQEISGTDKKGYFPLEKKMPKDHKEIDKKKLPWKNDNKKNSLFPPSEEQQMYDSNYNPFSIFNLFK